MKMKLAARSSRLAAFLVVCFISMTGFAKSKTLFVPQKPQHVVLKNGIEIYFIEDHELPVLDLMFYVRGGSVYDPVGKEGLSGVMMQSLRLGGTQDLKAEDVEEKIEDVAGTLEMGAQPEYFSGTLSLLKKDSDLGLDILFSLLQKPRFQSDRFQLVKSHALEALERETEEPFSYTNKEFSKMVYQNDLHPNQPVNTWGRFPSKETLQSISLEDVKAYFGKMLGPDRLVLAVSGDISKDELVQKIESRTQSWSRCATSLPPIDLVKPEQKPREKILTRPGLTQSTIFLGHLGTSRDNPDKFAIQVMNFLLGGGGALNSRMGEEIRSNAGKAYVVYSDFGFGKDKGVFRLIAQTALANTDWVVKKFEKW
ncbi:MAG: insulinase family protein [Deltaproteobacteria bacterium]|nr:MAG: insulinase family protein [Deltaproteobacteria bacterium]